jgi:hypothetical protein
MMAFAWVVLCAWPIVIIQMFNRMPVERALIWSIMGGYLFLPPVVSLDLPLLPPLNKNTIPSITAFVCLLMLAQKPQFKPQNPLVLALVLLLPVSSIGTVLVNSEPVVFASGYELQGLEPRVVVSFMLNQGVLLLPLLLGLAVLRTEAAMKELVRAYFIGGLIYSIPMLIEVRLSPQLNIWIYGFFQHSFDQAMRFGGFRPVVFLPHGLWVALFAVMTVFCTLTLARYADEQDRPRYIAAALYLTFVLVLCKSLGALVYFLVVAPLLLLATRKTLITVAAVLAVIVLTYPILRGAGLIPVDSLIELFTRINPERAESLAFRLTNEGRLLEHAAEKPLFGWGGYSRNLVHDMNTGRNLTIADGQWIITIGIFGWIGYLVEFGLLTLPLMLLYLRTRRLENADVSPWLAALAIVHGVNLIDLLPNATLVPLTWLTCGALLGCLEQRTLARQPEHAAVMVATPRRTMI